MKKWTRAELRRRAVRAAAKAALLGTIACGEAATYPVERANSLVPPTFTQDAGFSSSPDTGAEDTAIADAGTIASPDAALADAGPACAQESPGLSEEEAWNKYVACCDAVGWDWSQGCMAWGPPVPPEMGVAA